MSQQQQQLQQHRQRRLLFQHQHPQMQTQHLWQQHQRCKGLQLMLQSRLQTRRQRWLLLLYRLYLRSTQQHL